MKVQVSINVSGVHHCLVGIYIRYKESEKKTQCKGSPDQVSSKTRRNPVVYKNKDGSGKIMTTTPRVLLRAAEGYSYAL